MKSVLNRSFLLSILFLSQVGFAQEQNDPQFPPTGGMWMPNQIPELEPVLKKLGLEINPKELSDPTSNTLNAIVSLGGCSGSFISKEGLIVTNWHCVQGYLSYITAKDNAAGINSDFVKTGFYAATKDKERYAGPNSRVFITTEITDVTEKITQGLLEIQDPLARANELESRQKALVKEAEASAPNTKADVKGFFRGEKYFLTKKLELKDLRVVYAPPEAIGFFGGDEKNWEFPRHVGDFALLRVYKGEGTAIDPAPENTPYIPKNIIKMATAPTLPGDLVLVSGYPGLTNRLSTYAESQDEFGEFVPALIEYLGDMQKIFVTLSEQSESLRTKTESARFGIANTFKNKSEALIAQEKIGYLPGKEKLQADLTAWIQSDPALVVQYGTSLEKMEAIRQKYKAGWQKRNNIARVFHPLTNPLFRSALVLARLANEKQKPDALRRPEYQEREWKRLKDEMTQSQTTYDRAISLEVLNYLLPKLIAETEVPAFVAQSFDLAAIAADPAQIKSQANTLIENSELEAVEKRLELFESLTWEQATASQDPLLRLAVLAVGDADAIEDLGKRASAENIYTTEYVKALRDFLKTRGQVVAPDANSSLRVTFGQVQGYYSERHKREIPAFTNLRDLVEKELKWGKKDFELPLEWMRAYESAKTEGYGKYADPIYSELPLNFVANVDTTGGNSGSAALNGRGELIGLLFDGNSESLYSDYKFDAKVRSILVDLRYLQWTLDKVVGADALLIEMGVKQPLVEVE